MDKKTKLYLGIGLLGVAAYLYFKPSKNMVGFAKLPLQNLGYCSQMCNGNNDYQQCIKDCLTGHAISNPPKPRRDFEPYIAGLPTTINP
jgi:hypothetical protein